MLATALHQSGQTSNYKFSPNFREDPLQAVVPTQILRSWINGCYTQDQYPLSSPDSTLVPPK
jgi:hypothetical protein